MRDLVSLLVFWEVHQGFEGVLKGFEVSLSIVCFRCFHRFFKRSQSYRFTSHFLLQLTKLEIVA
jgi:hypothetical protein